MRRRELEGIEDVDDERLREGRQPIDRQRRHDGLAQARPRPVEEEAAQPDQP